MDKKQTTNESINIDELNQVTGGLIRIEKLSDEVQYHSM